ncbi:MAG: hypothetical protein B1H02_07135 [Candidatus Latescibacteria bacterium 4484_107]|nr:MAG: hypothetical protein B1H02_07135 [Candidatus Latescibacteria bacterium 4484_107]
MVMNSTTRLPPNIIPLDHILPHVLFTHLYHCEPGWSMGKKFHSDCHEMFFILEGKGCLTLGETEYPAKRGDVFLIKPEQTHSAAADVSDPYVYYSLHYAFREGQGFSEPSAPEELSLLDTFFNTPYRSLSKIRLPEVSETRKIIEKMEVERTHKAVGYATMRSVYLLQLLTLVARVALQTTSPESTNPEVLRNRNLLIAHQIKRTLEEHLIRQVTLQDVADAIHLSPHYCCSVFKEVTGYTIFQYLDRLRVERAKMLLRHSHLNVTETAEELGYHNVYYFSRVFKRVTGMSPAQFAISTPGKSR